MDDPVAPFDSGRTARADGVGVAWRRFGPPSGPVVLAVHGFASTSTMAWESSGWIRALTADGRQVVTVDLRGHGRSDAPTDAAAYGIGILVDDLVAVIDDIASGPVDYLGYSLGSRLGWELAVRHPSLVRSLSLGGLPASEPLVAFDVAAASAYLTTGAPIDDEATRMFMALIEASENDASALVALAAGVRVSPRSDAAPTVPTLLVTGDNDDVAADGTGLVERVPGGRFVGVPGRTHVNTVSARAFKAAVLEFLASLD